MKPIKTVRHKFVGDLSRLENETISMKINQMKKKDEYFEGFYLIKRAEVRKTRAVKGLYCLTFRMILERFPKPVGCLGPYNVEEFTAGKVVHMEGRSSLYSGKPNNLYAGL